MLAFFGTIIIVYVMWLVVKPLVTRYARRKFEQKVNDMFRRAYGDAFGAGGGDGTSRKASAHNSAHAPGRKVFSREDGEYIEFEEIECTIGDTSYAAAAGTSEGNPRHTPREPQVSDAEWEEIV